MLTLFHRKTSRVLCSLGSGALAECGCEGSGSCRYYLVIRAFPVDITQYLIPFVVVFAIAFVALGTATVCLPRKRKAELERLLWGSPVTLRVSHLLSLALTGPCGLSPSLFLDWGVWRKGNDCSELVGWSLRRLSAVREVVADTW